MATFNYNEMVNVANELFEMFGNEFTLKKKTKDSIYNPITKKNTPVYKNYEGLCVKKTYTSEMIGSLTNIINAGDVQFKCILNDISVIPSEGVDQLVYKGKTYNILEVDTTEPSGDLPVIHTLHTRRV